MGTPSALARLAGFDIDEEGLLSPLKPPSDIRFKKTVISLRKNNLTVIYRRPDSSKGVEVGNMSEMKALDEVSQELDSLQVDDNDDKKSFISKRIFSSSDGSVTWYRVAYLHFSYYTAYS